MWHYFRIHSAEARFVLVAKLSCIYENAEPQQVLFARNLRKIIIKGPDIFIFHQKHLLSVVSKAHRSFHKKIKNKKQSKEIVSSDRKSQRFSDVFRGYRKKPVTLDGLRGCELLMKIKSELFTLLQLQSYEWIKGIYSHLFFICLKSWVFLEIIFRKISSLIWIHLGHSPNPSIKTSYILRLEKNSFILKLGWLGLLT